MNRFLVQSSRLLLLRNQLGASKNLSCTRELKQNTIVLESDDFRVETRDGRCLRMIVKKKRADGKTTETMQIWATEIPPSTRKRA